MYGTGDVVLMPKYSWERWVSMFDVHLEMLHISFINLIRILSSFLKSAFDNNVVLCIFCQSGLGAMLMY